MKALFNILILLFLVTACTSSQEENSNNQLSLNGTWQFIASNKLNENSIVKNKDIQWDTIHVPGNWDTRKRYSEYEGKGYYYKQFKVPTNWEKKQIHLKFNAVYETAKVWLNGEFLGKHVGGYTPFEFNITDKVTAGNSNSMVVMADNSYKRGAWWAWGGISRDVNLFASEEVRIIYQHITSEPDFVNKKVNYTIKYKLENNGDKEVSAKVYSNINGVEVDSLEMLIKAKSNAISSIKFQKELTDVKLWHFNNPYLYELNSIVKVENNKVDSVSDKFGVRKFEVHGEQFFLNNEAVRMNGVNRVHDHPDYGNTEPDHLIKSDLLDIKNNLGCNFSRLMHAPLSKNILKFCDSIGFLLVEEIPVWGENDPQSIPNNPLTKKWMKEMIERDYNHPSVVAWSVGNELRTTEPKWGMQHLTNDQYEYVNEMIDYTSSLDNSRLKTYVSNTSYQGGEIGNEPYENLDFLCVNSYGNAIKIIENVYEKFPNKPIFISEIGRGQIGPAPDAQLQEDLIDFMKNLKNYPYVTGISIWSYNDYRSNYKGTPESGFREWGIVDEKRNKKKAYYQLQEVYKEWQD
ncbi:glycoside hydrolase family 2 TIM barrel-domain containing protein [uncultured Lutibacter sp.]|uniref:glycoside hydrolase family 2 protein n=1 Tax=uncultured Lutibacter sp. TaxID=437739 RepID=UPI00260E4664|nr:glycoside hydrolase family 2 TIM barrel-domain containing protein [uncultured Lutibacter sp.]